MVFKYLVTYRTLAHLISQLALYFLHHTPAAVLVIPIGVINVVLIIVALFKGKLVHTPETGRKKERKKNTVMVYPPLLMFHYHFNNFDHGDRVGQAVGLLQGPVPAGARGFVPGGPARGHRGGQRVHQEDQGPQEPGEM